MDMTRAPLPPEGTPPGAAPEDTPPGSAAASTSVQVDEAPDVQEAEDIADLVEEQPISEDPDTNRIPAAVASEEEAGSDSLEDAAMTPSTSPGETSAVTSAANTDLCSALRRRYEGMSVDERQAMARDDVPVELRRRLSGCVSYAVHDRPRAAEEARPLQALTEDE